MFRLLVALGQAEHSVAQDYWPYGTGQYIRDGRDLRWASRQHVRLV